MQYSCRIGIAEEFFIYILLLCAGKGFQDGINAIFNVFGQKSMVLSSGSIPKTVKRIMKVR